MDGRKIGLAVWFLAVLPALPLEGQAAPNTRPPVLSIVRETVKVGHAAAHEAWETGWPRMDARFDSPFYILALTSISGPPEAWYLSGYDSFEHVGEYYQWLQDHPAAAAEDARLAAGDAAHLDGLRIIHAVVREDLSNGPMADLSRVRAFMITTVRTRPGQDQTFEGMLKQWADAMRTAGVRYNWGTYQVVTGMPEGTYLVLVSFNSLAGMDQVRTADAKAAGGISETNLAELTRRAGASVISAEAQLFMVSPRMSWVPKAMADSDPAFWRPKSSSPKPAMAPARKPDP